jgi:two-component system invasion response regulator UvrY
VIVPPAGTRLLENDMRVFLVDHEPIFREGLKSVMKTDGTFTVVGEAETCGQMLEPPQNTDIVILDGELDSITLLTALRRNRPKGQPPFVLVLTKHEEEHHAVQMLKAGADGYLYKSDPPATVLSAIRRIARGDKYIPHDLAETMIFSARAISEPSQLSNREYQVLHLFASGMRHSEIAAHLSLSVKTVATYRARILEKLNLKSNAQLMRYAFQKGMLD